MLGFKILNKKEQEELKERVVQFENNTGAELVIAIAQESDPYPGAVVRMAIFISLLATLILAYTIEFAYPYMYILAQFILTFLILPVGRINKVKSLALVDAEVDRETTEKSIEVFFTHCSDKSSHSNECLIYTSLFEKRVNVLVGRNIKEHVDQETLNEVVEIIKNGFKQKNHFQAYKDAISKLEEKILIAFPERVSDVSANELKNDILWL